MVGECSEIWSLKVVEAQGCGVLGQAGPVRRGKVCTGSEGWMTARRCGAVVFLRSGGSTPWLLYGLIDEK